MSCRPILSMYNLSELPWHYQNHPLPLNNSHCVSFPPLPPWFGIFSKLSLLACTHTDRPPHFGTKAAKHFYFMGPIVNTQNCINPSLECILTGTTGGLKQFPWRRKPKRHFGAWQYSLCQYQPPKWLVAILEKLTRSRKRSNLDHSSVHVYADKEIISQW